MLPQVTVPSRLAGGSRDATRSPSSRGFAPASVGRGDCGRPRRDCSGSESGAVRNGSGSRHHGCPVGHGGRLRRCGEPVRARGRGGADCLAPRVKWVGTPEEASAPHATGASPTRRGWRIDRRPHRAGQAVGPCGRAAGFGVARGCAVVRPGRPDAYATRVPYKGRKTALTATRALRNVSK